MDFAELLLMEANVVVVAGAGFAATRPSRSGSALSGSAGVGMGPSGSRAGDDCGSVGSA
ncbi:MULTISPECIES: hypothetical protein [unclassified Streptomyces]|uniref:hypothetical protein n=1 Tax=unclassified Streptomyces TaxID=2593676 RepID=UPI001BE6535B|nr:MULTISPECIES: hypothetical protein [unclassified Streptomyces]MBT2406340.1 hypothetical protein [Streptomyces sp. ISL-21]MBT2607564.1 hypothetical protein [Streptomyces sp. ISL-87]